MRYINRRFTYLLTYLLTTNSKLRRFLFITDHKTVAVLRSVGRLFQALGAATEINALLSSRRLVRGTTYSSRLLQRAT